MTPLVALAVPVALAISAAAGMHAVHAPIWAAVPFDVIAAAAVLAFAYVVREG